MFGEKFATRLNSFSSKPDIFWQNSSTSLAPERLIERAGTVKGLTDLDLNFPDHAGKNLNKIMNSVEDNGLGINGFAMRYYTNPAFKLGAFTNPDKKVRKEAIDLTKKGIDAARESNSNLITIWLGQDGYDYGFQVDYQKIWQDEIDGIREVALHDKECKISIEYKPNEPRAYSLLANLPLTLLAIKEIDLSNLGVTLDFAHILYANEQPAFAAAMVSRNTKILGLHLNDGYAKRDDGLMVGSVHQLATIELLYQVNKDGYDGTIYFDTFPDASGLAPVKECEGNIRTVKSMLKVVKTDDIDKVIGTEVGVSDWVIIDQDRIDKFADATMDHQFIHVDPEQASPVFGSTIAHGFLSLSLVAGIPFDQEIGMVLEGTKMGLNYGLDKVRFLSPVPVNSEVRIHMKCIDITEKNPGQYLAKTEVTMEIKGVDKPAFVAETLSMFVL